MYTYYVIINGISEELFEILNRENEIALEETAEKVTALVYDKMK